MVAGPISSANTPDSRNSAQNSVEIYTGLIRENLSPGGIIAELRKGTNQSKARKPLPDRYFIGQELDWEAPSVPVVLTVELPFWIMVPYCIQNIAISGHVFKVEIRDDYIERYARVIIDSRLSCIYIGPDNPSNFNPVIAKQLKKARIPFMDRKCKTTLCIHSSCNRSVLELINQDKKPKHAARAYLKSLCEAHIEVINNIVQCYRLSTYDYFAYEVSPWDVPIWFIRSELVDERIVLLDYAQWDQKPQIHNNVTDPPETYTLIEPSALQSAMTLEPSAGEFELLDALNFMERGDHTGAIRRITTAIEAQLQSALYQELLKLHPANKVAMELNKTKNNFPKRLDQYMALSKRKLSKTLTKDLNATREIRHSIVHSGLRISFLDRGRAQRCIDTGRWIFNWLENVPARRDLREKKIGMRSLGRHHTLFYAEITDQGAIVHKPGPLD